MSKTSRKPTKQQLYWHFLPDDGRLRFKPRKKIVVGRTLRIKDQPVLCCRGFHASKRVIDALQFAPGALVCRVTLGGIVLHAEDKSVAQERTVLWKADATRTLHEFACWCAKKALRTAKVEDERCWNAIAVKLKWLKGEATDDELSAAWAAAQDAAWAAALSAAWAAAQDAALYAALYATRAATRAAARAAAQAAAWAAALSAQNRKLESMLNKLNPRKDRA